MNPITRITLWTSSSGAKENMRRWNFPCDPECPEYAEFSNCLFDDPMTEAMGAPVDDIMEGFERKHRGSCKRCQEFGAENVEVV